MEAVFDQLSDALVLYDTELNITGANLAAERLLGIAAQDMMGRNCREVFHCPECAPGCGLLEGLHQGPSSPHSTVRLHTAGDRERLVLIRTAQLFNGDGKLEGAIATIKDVSEPFIAINCAAIPETLIESELFGYEKGAFTDARAQKRGLLELADKGTLFLDEIGEVPLTLQAKLLRVLEEQSFRRLGGLRDIRVDLRLVAATNKNLREAVKEGAFRQDLYFRLNVIQIVLPALRDRREDIVPLAEFFIDHYNRKFKRHIEGLSAEAAARSSLAAQTGDP